MSQNEPLDTKDTQPEAAGFFDVVISAFIDMFDKVKVRLRAARWVLTAALVIFVFFALAEQISWLEAGFFAVVLVGIALVGAPGAAPRMRQTSRRARRRQGYDARQLHAQSKALVDILPSPCIVLDRERRVKHVNGSLRQIYPQIQVGDPISFGLRQPDLLDGIAQVLSEGQPTRVSYADRVPHEIFLVANIVPMFADENSNAGSYRNGPDLMIITLRDRTSEQMAEQMRVDFVANASHELRTPLQALMGFMDTLAGPAKDDEEARAKFIAIMHAQSERMSRLIDDLMSLSHIELNRHVRPTQNVDLVAVINEVIDVARNQAEREGVTIDFVQQGGSAEVVGDRDQLYQVFDNLVQNAVKYGATGERVEVVLQPAKSKYHTVWVDIRDFGAGIAPEHVPRLTERFYRVDVETSRQKKGTGLGLAIVKHILVRHRGELAIKSAPGDGTTFTVKI